jgi:hypothetical protein
MKEGERGRKRRRNEEKNKEGRKMWRKVKSVEGWKWRRK